MTWRSLVDLDVDALAAAWRAARPFPHIVVDDVVDDVDALLARIEEEPVERYVNDLYAFDATAPGVGLDDVREAFGAAFAPALARITGKPCARADLRAFAYRAGDYLLPHTDHQDGLARLVAYAYYLPSPEPPVGGELELYRRGEAGYVSEVVIAPRANRIAIFDVGDATLHQVREVTSGMRLSLAGWFYA